MLKKELAQLLGVSESIVSRHAKKGMPTDSLERAQRWRKRHLEPGRVKGVRFDPAKEQAARALSASSAPAVDLSGLIAILNAALLAGPVPCDAPALMDVRHALRTMTGWRESHALVAAPVRVWVRLLAYAYTGATHAGSLDPSACMTLGQFVVETAPPGCCADALSIMEMAWDVYAMDGGERLDALEPAEA